MTQAGRPRPCMNVPAEGCCPAPGATCSFKIPSQPATESSPGAAGISPGQRGGQGGGSAGEELLFAGCGPSLPREAPQGRWIQTSDRRTRAADLRHRKVSLRLSHLRLPWAQDGVTVLRVRGPGAGSRRQSCPMPTLHPGAAARAASCRDGAHRMTPCPPAQP